MGGRRHYAAVRTALAEQNWCGSRPANRSAGEGGAGLAGFDGLYDHAGEEFGIVLSGTLELKVEDQTFTVRRGDTFYFSM
jgi:hypothetical protein